MKFLNTLTKNITKSVSSMPILYIGLACLVVALVVYNTQKGKLFASYSNLPLSPSEYTQMESPIESSEMMNSGLSQPSEIPNNTSPDMNPSELLPNNTNNDLTNHNFLNASEAGRHMGVNTVGSSLRNANLQLRSEPANPRTNVSPWLQTTIEPDLERKPLEDCM